MNRKSINSRKIKGFIPGIIFAIASILPAICAIAIPSNPSNVRKLEQALTELYNQQTGVPITSVSCPDNANLNMGSTFECQAKAQGIQFGIQVKIKNNEGYFDSNSRGLLILSKVEELIQKLAQESTALNVSADCGGKLRVAIPGETFTCQVKRQQGELSTAQVKVKDEQGNIEIKL